MKKQNEFLKISSEYNSFGIKFYNENVDTEYFQRLSSELIKKTLLNDDNKQILFYVMLKKFSKKCIRKFKKK